VPTAVADPTDIAPFLTLGSRRYDITVRALVMGIANRTPDSFFDKGSYFSFDRFLSHCEGLVTSGADLIDIGGVKAGAGPEVSLEEELERVVPAVEAAAERFDVAVSIDTWRAAVAASCYEAGAVLGNDISGFSDPDYLPVAARAGASVVATHIRLAPRVPDPEASYDDVVATVKGRLSSLGESALHAGLSSEQIVVDAGLDLGKTTAHSLELLGASKELSLLGYPLLLSASNKTFLGELLDLSLEARRDASLAAAALGIAGGCRILRVHDVAGTVRLRDMLAFILGERQPRR
jgi:dihydropteroate synthase